MARKVKSAVLDSKTARLDKKLKARAKPYYVSIDKGVDLGYRKGIRTSEPNPTRRAGRWVVRRYVGDEKYVVESLDAWADDFGEKNGKDILDFWQAQARARERAKGKDGAPAKTDERPQTVGDAVAAYIKSREARSAANGRDARYRLSSVLKDKKFASKMLAKLSSTDLDGWLRSLSADLKPATIRRTGNDLRAALSAAVDRDWRNLPDTIRNEIKVGLKSPANAGGDARHALLTDSDIRRIVDAAYAVDEDFGALVLVLAATGTRYSQAGRITVAGLQADAERLIVPASVKGRGEKKRTDVPVPVGSDVIARLKPIVAGRAGHEPLLLRTDQRATKDDKRASWEAASLMQRPWRKALEAAGVPYVEPYALRHSSIVRMLRKGLPVRIVAGLHDTSVVMIERHYSAFILDMADELARQAIVSLTSAPARPLRVVG